MNNRGAYPVIKADNSMVKFISAERSPKVLSKVEGYLLVSSEVEKRVSLKVVTMNYFALCFTTPRRRPATFI